MDNLCSFLVFGGHLLSGLITLRFTRLVILREISARNGDLHAASHLILPCYKNLLRTYAALSISFLLLILGVFYNIYTANKFIQYGGMISLVFHMIPLVLYMHPLSANGVGRTFVLIFVYIILLSIIWIESLLFETLLLELLFICSLYIPVSFLSFLVLVRWIPSRIQRLSFSSKALPQFLIITSLIQLSFDTAFSVTRRQSALLGLSMTIFLSGSLFPFVLFRSLLADTKYWRGLGKHNQGGIGLQPITSTEITMHVSGQLQSILSDCMIDFAFIKIGQHIGKGSSADVYSGFLKNSPIALKVYTPPEVTLEALEKIKQETAITSALQHSNIVRFYGICVRPPHVAMVIELCVRGCLQTSLMNYSSEWNDERRMLAMCDAVRAVSYLHSKGYIHRDIKTSNFFVDDLWRIKLGDFGECTKIRTQASNGARMTVLGTVAYMAPEIVRADKYYSEAVDIYGLGITMCEILSGNPPFENVSTFNIYDNVLAGQRPHIPESCSEDLKLIITQAWDSNSALRPSALQLLHSLFNICIRKYNWKFQELDISETNIVSSTQISIVTDDERNLYDVYPCQSS